MRAIGVTGVVAASFITAASTAVAQHAVQVEGRVLSEAGAPIASATISLEPIGGIGRQTASDADGRYRLPHVPPASYRLRASAPGHTARALHLQLPPVPVDSIELPPIALEPATYLTVRLLTPSGEPIVSPRIIGDAFDPLGRSIAERSDRWVAGSTADGRVTIGPLPRGVALLAVDTPPFARTRLPDTIVAGDGRATDIGTVVVQPGASLRVLVRDRSARPLVGQDVRLSDDTLFSPLTWPGAITDAEGRTVFDRLAPGRYRVTVGRFLHCGQPMPPVVRWVTVPTSKRATLSIVMGGVDTTIRLTSAGAPVAGASAWLTAGPPPAPPVWLRADASRRVTAPSQMARPCEEQTDADGRATFVNSAPGRARLHVRFTHSMWSRSVSIPPRAAELPISVPPGTLALRIVDAGEPETVPMSAIVRWTSAAGEVVAQASPTGDVLLDAVDGPGTLQVDAPGYRARQIESRGLAQFTREVALERTPTAYLRVRVITDGHQPVAGAAVMLTPTDPMADVYVLVTDVSGLASFPPQPAGQVALIAAAPGFEPSEAIPAAVPESGDGVLTIELR